MAQQRQKQGIVDATRRCCSWPDLFQHSSDSPELVKAFRDFRASEEVWEGDKQLNDFRRNPQFTQSAGQESIAEA